MKLNKLLLTALMGLTCTTAAYANFDVYLASQSSVTQEDVLESAKILSNNNNAVFQTAQGVSIPLALPSQAPSNGTYMLVGFVNDQNAGDTTTLSIMMYHGESFIIYDYHNNGKPIGIQVMSADGGHNNTYYTKASCDNQGNVYLTYTGVNNGEQNANCSVSTSSQLP